MEQTDQAMRLIERKSVLIDQLYLFAERQLEMINDMDMTSLLSLLSRKQHAIVEIEALDEKLKPFHAEAPENRVWSCWEVKEKCEATIDDCKSKIKQIMELERLAEQNLIEKKNFVQKQLKQVDQGASIHRAYRKTTSHAVVAAASGFDLSSG